MDGITVDESGETVETEPVDVTPVDAALMQDRFDEYTQLAPEPVPADESSTKKQGLVEAPDKLKKESPKTGIPSVDEWQSFIGRFVIRTVTDAYISWALKDIEDLLTPHEREMISLTKEDVNDLAAPLATMAHKNKLARKHGRSIIAAADSYESVFAMVFWMRRVNKLAKKYRPAKPKNDRVIRGEYQEGNNGNVGSNEGQGTYVNPGFGVYNPGSGG